MVKYVVTAGDCTSDDYAAALYPEAELISLRLADNGEAAFNKFNELGSDAIMITSTSPLHFGSHADEITKKYAVKQYLSDLNYTLVSKDDTIEYGTSFPGKSVGGISPLVGKVAAHLVGASKYVKYYDPDVSTAAALSGEVDIVSKPSRNGIIDTEGGMHLVCDLTKEFGLKLQYYVIEHGSDNDEEALNIFNKEREDIQKFSNILAA